jgi:hypothetical protein
VLASWKNYLISKNVQDSSRELKIFYFEEMSKKKYNENGFYELCANHLYGNCITNCIYFYGLLKLKIMLEK